MKVWHKILVAPAVAIAFLLGLGAVSFVVMSQQNAAMQDLVKNRMSGYEMAAEAAQEVSEVHSNVYRLFTWIANLKEDKIQKITAEEKGKIDAVIKAVSQFSAGADLTAEERKLAQAVLPKLAKYRKDVDAAIDLSTVDISTGAMAMQTADTQFQSMLKDFTELVALEKKLAQDSYIGALGARHARRSCWWRPCSSPWFCRSELHCA